MHFGRVSHGRLRAGSQAELVEVISSPTRAVLRDKNESLFGAYREAPTDHLPIAESREVMHRKNHFATVRFFSGETGG